MAKVKLKRDRSQEGGSVLRWYQYKRVALVSVVEGDHQDDVEWRVSYGDKSETYRGSKQTFNQKSESQKKAKAEFLVNRL